MSEFVTTAFNPDGSVCEEQTAAEVVAPVALFSTLAAAVVAEEPPVGLVTLERAKLKLRIEHDLEDVEIKALIRAAYRAIEGLIFRRIYPDADAMGLDLTGVVADEDLNAAVLLLVVHLHAHPGSEDSPVPQTIGWLVQSHVNYAGGA